MKVAVRASFRDTGAGCWRNRQRSRIPETTLMRALGNTPVFS